MHHRYRWLWLLGYGAAIVLGYPGTLHSEEIIPRGSVLSTVAGTEATIYAAPDAVASDDDRVLTTVRFRHDGWGERSAPWVEQVNFEMSHGYDTGTMHVTAGVLLHGDAHLQHAGAAGRIDLGSSGRASLAYRDSPEYDVDIAVPVGASMSLLVGGFRREISVSSLPAFDTPFTITGNSPTVRGAYGGIRAAHRDIWLQGTVGTANASLKATVVPSDITLVVDGGFDEVYTGTIGYRGSRLAITAGGVYAEVGAGGRATARGRTIGSAEPESKNAGTYRAWHAEAALNDTFRIGLFQHRLRLRGLAGYFDLSEVAPILNGVVPNRFNYTVSDISAELSEAGASGWLQATVRRWYIGAGGALSFYTARAEYAAFYRRLGLFREEVGDTLVDSDGFLLTTSSRVTIPLIPTVTLSVSYTGVVPVSFDYLKETDAATIVSDSAEAAGSWQGSRIEVILRVAAPSIIGR